MAKKKNLLQSMEEDRRNRRTFRQAMAKELREHKSSFLVFSVLRILVIVSLVRQIMRGSYESAFFCLLALCLLYLPSWLQVKLRIELPPPLEITILCFIYAAEILGEVNAFYVVVPNWDTMLHTLNGFLAAAVGFSMVILLNDNEKLTFELSPFFLALLAFCFSMTIGVLWEFFEFFMDTFLHTDMQKDTIIHTIHSVTLDPTRSNQPGAAGIPGHRAHRHHEGPDGEFPGGPGLLRHRLLLCPKQGQKENPRPELCPQQENRRPGLPPAGPPGSHAPGRTAGGPLIPTPSAPRSRPPRGARLCPSPPAGSSPLKDRPSPLATCRRL